jgi:DNA transformation protein
MPIRRPPLRSTAPRPAGEPALATLPGLGPKSQAMLVAAGIPDLGTLRRLGAVAAYARVKHSDPRASLNLLWGLESALTGLPWQTVAREHRTSLLLALDALEESEARRLPRR